MSQELRAKILILLDDHSRTGSSQYFEDAELSALTGADLQEVRRQMDILEADEFTTTANSHDGYAARISPKGVVAVEKIREAAQAGSGRKIGF